MKQTINFTAFDSTFERMGRITNFSYEGRRALFDYLESCETDTGEEIELDVIALCCDYSEFDDLEDFQQQYDADEFETMKDIEDCTTVIYIGEPHDGENGFIIENF